MRIVKIVLVCLAVVFALMQFVRIDKSNPPVEPEKTMEAAINVPPDIQQIMARSCNDCHSNKTVYPWYTNVAPVSWWLRNHIEDGRRHLNVSEYATYAPKKREHKLEEICEQVRSGEMPLPSYLIVHRESALAPSEIDAICAWTDVERKKFVLE
jgi:hypothetical protein